MSGPRRDERRLYTDLAWTWPVLSPPSDYKDEARQFWGHLRNTASGPSGRSSTSDAAGAMSTRSANGT